MTIATIASIHQMAERALSNVATVQASYAIAKAAIEAQIPGDFVECGVFAGTQAAAMARAVMENDHGQHPHYWNRRVHLFDTFTGIPQAGPEDKEFLAAGHPEGLSACSLEAVMKHMDEWGISPGVLNPVPGLFQDTVPMAVSGNYFPNGIAVLRLDGDLYESTKVCIEHLYPKLSPGGWLIVDDFALSGCRKAVMEYLGGGCGPAYFQKQ